MYGIRQCQVMFSSGRISALFAKMFSVVIEFKFTLPDIEFDSYYHHRRTAIGAEGGCSPPIVFQIAIIGQKSGIFVQGMNKIFGQETSAPWTKLVPYIYNYHSDISLNYW